MKVTRSVRRIVVAGASSLLGNELKQLLGESRFADADLRLLDEEILAGTLTQVSGEPAVIQAVEEDSFHHADVVFFAGSPEFARTHYPTAKEEHSLVVDLTSGLRDLPGALSRIPGLDSVLQQDWAQRASVYISPSGPAIICATLAAALSQFQPVRLVVILFQPASESGRAGVEELESQTAQLLSFQPVGQSTFDVQVAFNLLDRYGDASTQRLSDARARILAEVKQQLGMDIPTPSIQLVHAPVFYGHAFTAYAEIAVNIGGEQIVGALRAANAVVREADVQATSNVTVAGESFIHIAEPMPDEVRRGAWWFWGAADNLRMPAANALAILEKILQ
jgi:aspartate-semialdehyde dehydrogenase